MPSTRWSASAWEETSIATPFTPASTIRARSPWSSSASGVVWPAGGGPAPTQRLRDVEAPIALEPGDRDEQVSLRHGSRIVGETRDGLGEPSQHRLHPKRLEQSLHGHTPPGHRRAVGGASSSRA